MSHDFHSPKQFYFNTPQVILNIVWRRQHKKLNFQKFLIKSLQI
jgi:hypothetical protein